MQKFNKNSIVVISALAVSLVVGFAGSSTAFAASPPAVNLGTAANFAILAKTAITTTGVTLITGDIGVSPAAASTITGFSLVLDGSGTFSTSALVTGKVYAANYTAPTPTYVGTAVSNMLAAYTDATSRATTVLNAGAVGCAATCRDLAGTNLVAGVYTFDGAGNVVITNDFTLSGSASDVWIFQIPGTLDISVNKKIILSGGAQASNIFWAVAGTTTLEPGSTFEGNILGGPGASTIAGQNGAILHGRALGQTDVTLIANTIPVIFVPPVTPASSGGAGPRYVPLIGITNVPTPLALPGGSGSVTYNYTVWDIGHQSLNGVAVTDNKCSPAVYLSGDANGNGILDPSENWQYSCTTTVSTTTTNAAIATGYSYDTYNEKAIATAFATVVVGSPLPAPLISVVKVPSQLTPLAYGGGNVTYTYTVKNPGVVAMNNMTVADDKCASVYRTSGDSNNNNLLDPGETWTYTCSVNVPISTKNVATAKGQANGFTAFGYAFATVLVSAPSLPNTGFPPKETSGQWNIVILSGILAVALTSIIVALKRKRTI
ncbi:MAG: ice-binding family protein [Minisyncoccia bacterium]|jgi:hypothetical protein